MREGRMHKPASRPTPGRPPQRPLGQKPPGSIGNFSRMGRLLPIALALAALFFAIQSWMSS